MCTDKRARGYSLIEALVAMMIVALALTVLMRLFSGGLQGLAVSTDYARAVVVAESQLAAAGSVDALAVGEINGADGKYRWTQKVEEYSETESAEVATLPVMAYRVTIAVDWKDSGRTRSLNLSTLKLDRRHKSGDRM